MALGSLSVLRHLRLSFFSLFHRAHTHLLSDGASKLLVAMGTGQSQQQLRIHAGKGLGSRSHQASQAFVIRPSFSYSFNLLDPRGWERRALVCLAPLNTHHTYMGIVRTLSLASYFLRNTWWKSVPSFFSSFVVFPFSQTSHRLDILPKNLWILSIIWKSNLPSKYVALKYMFRGHSPQTRS